MGHRTFEADRDGRISIYPCCDGPRDKGIIRRILIKIVNAFVKLWH